MKTLKYLTICLVMCLFSGSTFAVCFSGVNPNISGVLNDAISGPPATNAAVGDTIYYYVNVSVPLGNCEHKNITGTITLPDESVVALPSISDCPIPPCLESLGVVATYVVNPDDIGKNGANPGELRATVELTGTAVFEDGSEDPEAGGFAPYPTRVLATPCVDVTKEPKCEYTKIWPEPDNDTVTYEYEIINCTEAIPGVDANVLITDVTDSILGNITTDFEAASPYNPANQIPPGGSVPFSVTYIPLPGDVNDLEDPNVIQNIVVVNSLAVATGEVLDPVQADASVELVYPSFRVDVTCENGDTRDNAGTLEQRFEVTYTNTGDVDLLVTDDIGNVNLELDVGVPVGPIVVWEPMTPDVGGTNICGLGSSASATLTVSATGKINQDVEAECVLGQDIPLDDDSVDTATCSVDLPCPAPSFTVTKICDSDEDGVEDTGCDLVEGDTASYLITITNTSPSGTGCPEGTCLYFELTDPAAGITTPVRVPDSGCVPGNGGTETYRVYIDVPACIPPGTGGEIEMPNTVFVEGFCDSDGTSVGTDDASANCCYTEQCGDLESCTPGYWKNNPECWCTEITLADGSVLPISEDTPLVAVWSELGNAPYVSDFGGDTLMDALKYGGGRGLTGKTRNMLRHAVAALLNACNTEVQSYPISVQQVIDGGNLALANGLDEVPIPGTDPVEYELNVMSLKEALAFLNEEFPCPLAAYESANSCQRNID